MGDGGSASRRVSEVCLVLALPKPLGAAKVLLEVDGWEGGRAAAPLLRSWVLGMCPRTPAGVLGFKSEINRVLVAAFVLFLPFWGLRGRGPTVPPLGTSVPR